MNMVNILELDPDKLIVVNTDNAADVVAAVKILSNEEVAREFGVDLGEYGVSDYMLVVHLRCLGHRLNLVIEHAARKFEALSEGMAAMSAACQVSAGAKNHMKASLGDGASNLHLANTRWLPFLTAIDYFVENRTTIIAVSLLLLCCCFFFFVFFLQSSILYPHFPVFFARPCASV